MKKCAVCVQDTLGTYMNEAELEFAAKMQAEGLSDAFVSSFISIYSDLVEGKTGMIPGGGGLLVGADRAMLWLG